ncbi:hypothetical protein [Tenacibaculum maritimum]
MEQPNLTYIAQLARGDKAIKKELIHIVKTEFPEEKREYYKNLESRNFKK